MSSQDIDSTLDGRLLSFRGEELNIWDASGLRLSSSDTGKDFSTGDSGRRGDKGGGMYSTSIGGTSFTLFSNTLSRIGDLENDRCGIFWLGRFLAPLYGSKAEAKRDSLLFGTCEAGISLGCGPGT
jgi:hypothetical protein